MTYETKDDAFYSEALNINNFISSRNYDSENLVLSFDNGEIWAVENVPSYMIKQITDLELPIYRQGKITRFWLDAKGFKMVI